MASFYLTKASSFFVQQHHSSEKYVDAASKEFEEKKIKYHKIQELWSCFDVGHSWHLS
jgi:DNA-directed RNA polymerase subunit K/omega